MTWLRIYIVWLKQYLNKVCQASDACTASMVLKCILARIEWPKQVNAKEMLMWSIEIKPIYYLGSLTNH